MKLHTDETHMAVRRYNDVIKVPTDRYGRKDLIDEQIASLLRTEPSESSSQISRQQDEYENIRTEPGGSLGMESAENWNILLRELSCSSPEDLAIQCRKRTKSNTNAAHSAVRLKKKEKSLIPNFIEAEVENHEKNNVTRRSHFSQIV
ncbi:hypothetical protein MRX96_050432 [Rhipicephalus microplus]